MESAPLATNAVVTDTDAVQADSHFGKANSMNLLGYGLGDESAIGGEDGPYSLFLGKVSYLKDIIPE